MDDSWISMKFDAISETSDATRAGAAFRQGASEDNLSDHRAVAGSFNDHVFQDGSLVDVERGHLILTEDNERNEQIAYRLDESVAETAAMQARCLNNYLA